MSTYEPGTVAVATVRGVPNVRVIRYTSRAGFRWLEASTGTVNIDEQVTDIRPLVVLDLNECEYGRDAIIAALRTNDPASRYHQNDWLADQIEQQTKPPRIPEPGLWGVVEAGVKEHDQRLRWVRLGDNYRPDDRDEYDRLWCDLIDPTLVRTGIEEES
jgi:hypothetical protein